MSLKEVELHFLRKYELRNNVFIENKGIVHLDRDFYCVPQFEERGAKQC